MRRNVTDLKQCVSNVGALNVRGMFFNYSVINVHTPTEDKVEQEKDEFYDIL